jgi:3-isopropylmalate dehydrogenase
MEIKVTILPGDGIGPEVTDQAILVLEAIGSEFGHEARCFQKDIGGAALTQTGNPLPQDTLDTCLSSGAVLLGAVGGPAFDHVDRDLRPEAGLLRLRRELGVFANLRPAVCFPALEDCSPLRGEKAHGTDILIVRELLGGLYFGQPRQTHGQPGMRVAVDTMSYSEPEIERIARVAFELAQTRRRKLTSVDKANVLDCSRLWREVVTRMSREYPGVRLSHMYVDSAAMVLVAHPAEFDVLLTENMFGDILSDQAGGIVGSLGLLASASIGGAVGLYEPVHGSAPDIAGKNIANPLGAILSVAMLLRHSFGMTTEAECVEDAVRKVLSSGARTADLVKPGQTALSTSDIGERIVTAVTNSKRDAIHSAVN